MSNPSGPDRNAESSSLDRADDRPEPATEILAAQDDVPDDGETTPQVPAGTPGERRFTAPSGMDAGSTQIIDRPPEPETEIMYLSGEATAPTQIAAPQLIPPRADAQQPPSKRRSWGWVVALILVIAALVAVAVLGTVLLGRHNDPAASNENRVRDTIQSFDTAIQNGDLATLRSITCGETADSYNKYDDKQWTDTHTRVAAAKQYPVVASIDQVLVNGGHAEANVTSFMAFDPATRSTRSFDLEFRDDQWKICQAPGS
jgi:flagellar basal body-associated protein FliL